MNFHGVCTIESNLEDECLLMADTLTQGSDAAGQSTSRKRQLPA